MAPRHFKKVELSDIKVTKAKYNKGHRYASIFLKKESLMVHLPKMRVPFGVSEFKGKYSIDLSFDEMDGEVGEFYKKMKEFEEYIEGYAKENMKELFETKSAEISYKSCLSEKKPFPPLLKTKIVMDNNGDLKVDVYDEKKEKQKGIEMIKKNSKVRGVIECSGIWISERDEKFVYGVTWKVNQVKVYEDVCFIEDSDIDSDELDFLEE